MNIKSEAENRIKYWNELGGIDGLKDKIHREQEKLKIFQEILILPGIEFEAFPGIHILLIFDSQIDEIIKKIEDFLYEKGYSIDNQGRETVDVSCVSAVEIINSAYEMGAITIAAHIDSDKGALDKLEDSGRVQFFKNETLNGVQIVKPETIDFLKNLLGNKEYRRNKELAFVRFSDFHNRECIDGKISYLRMENISFDSIKNVITEHPELISFTPRIEDVDCIKSILKNPDTISFENLRGKNIENISKAICAILNRGKGVIVLGIGNKGSIVGIKKPIKEIEQEIKAIYDVYNNNMAYFKHVEDYYELGELIVVIIRIWSIGHIVFEYNSEVYLFDEKKRVKKALINEIFELGEKNYRDSFIRIDNMNRERIKYIQEQTALLDKSRNNVELNRKILKYSVVSQNVFNTSIITNILEIEYDFDGLGIVDGNLFHVPIFDAHYTECYSRLTCPSFEIDFEKQDIEAKYFRTGECAVVNSRFDVH
ncbi:RNA-binding domain-containing protein [Lachnospiraceae bacterium 46-15]